MGDSQALLAATEPEYIAILVLCRREDLQATESRVRGDSAGMECGRARFCVSAASKAGSIFAARRQAAPVTDR